MNKHNLKHVYIGGTANGDFLYVHMLIRDGGTTNWSCMKDDQPGDDVLIYIREPWSAMLAKAKVIGKPYRGDPAVTDWDYLTKLGHFEMLPNQTLTIPGLKRVFPKWKWLKYPRAHAHVPAEIANELWALAHKKPHTAAKGRTR